MNKNKKTKTMTRGNFAKKIFVTICRGIGEQLKDGDFCDLTVVVGQIEFSCHRVVLASVSTFFKTSLKPCWREASNRKVDITHEDVSPEAFGYLMDILYKGENVVREETAKNILKMSIYLQIKFLEDYCLDFLQETLKPETCLDMWQFALMYNLEELTRRSFYTVLDEMSVVSQQEEMLTLPKSLFLILLSEQKKLKMDDICKTVLRWVEADQDARYIHLSEFIPFMCFLKLSSDYLCEIVTYLNHPFGNILFEKINESLTYRIKGQQEKDSTIRRRILARQPLPFTCPEMKTRDIIIGGYTEVNKSTKDTFVLHFGDASLPYDNLAPLQGPIGVDFASCTLNNEVYVSGGSELPRFFAVYKPGDNEWEVLPSAPENGREKHAMASNNCSNIFVFGGLTKNSDGDKVISSKVLVYDIHIKEWRDFCDLPVGVQETTAAVLGHRIYLFGGVDCKGANTDVVQCVDTLSGCVYQAGRLPSPTCGARALSSGGRIYVLIPEGDVLTMSENFLLAELIEKRMSEEKDNGKSNTIRSTVSFKKMATMKRRHHFSACLHAGEIIVCGGESKDGQLLRSIETISLLFGRTSWRFSDLKEGRAKFSLHQLNVPILYLSKDPPLSVDSSGDASPANTLSLAVNARPANAPASIPVVNASTSVPARTFRPILSSSTLPTNWI